MKKQRIFINRWLRRKKWGAASVLLVFGLGLNLFSFTGCHQAEQIKTKLPKLDGLMDLALGRSVSTDINDAFPVAFWLEDLGKKGPPKQTTTMELLPGHYRMRLQSYCLQAGSYGPDSHEGHLLAPLQGSRANVMRSILLRSADFPQIAQSDIQQVMWSLEAGLAFNELPLDLQQRTRPLINQIGIQDIVNWLDRAKDLAKLALPEEARKLLQTYENMQQLVKNAQLAFQTIERFAVLAGTPPVGKGSRSVSSGQWAYAGEGFYARTIPETYSTTVVEVFRPEPYSLKRDNKDRIAILEVGDSRFENFYHKDSERDYVKLPNGRRGHIWRLKSVKITGPKNQGMIWCNPGWIVASDNPADVISGIEAEDFNNGFLAFGAASSSPGIIMADARANNYGDIAKDFYRRSKWVIDQKKKLDEYRDEFERASRPVDEQAFQDIVDITHYKDGLEAAKNPSDVQGKVEWISKTGLRVRNAFEYASKRLESVYGAIKHAFGTAAGDLPAPDARFGRQHRRFNPSGLVSAPANTSRQSLGLSSRLAR